MAELVAEVDECDRNNAWHGDGFRSLAHWMCVECGFDLPQASELVRVAQALRDLPLTRAAFASGALSFDKVRQLTKVALDVDEEMWLGVAAGAHGAQLTRICRAYARATSDRDDTYSQRGVTWWWREDGMLALSAVFSPEDGAIVIRAIEKAMRPPTPSHSDAQSRRADAVVSLCTRSERPVPARLVVHIEADNASIEDGPSIPGSLVKFLGCDSQVVAITERDGTPLDVGRARRLVAGRLRAAIQTRDRHCRYPGCAVPARQTHAHHIEHWMDGGKTDLANLVSLCGFHHRRLHNREYMIATDEGGVQFRGRGGWPIVPPTLTAPAATIPTAALESPRAQDGGRINDFGYVISVLADSSDYRQRHRDD
jgi:hypothetical protein